MGLVSGFSGATNLVKIALVLAIVGSLLNWVSFTTTSWGVIGYYTYPDQHIGLWRICSDYTKGCSQTDGTPKVWYGVFQAFAVFGFMGMNSGCAFIALYVFWGNCQKDRECGLAAGIACITCAVCWLIAVIIFGASFHKNLEFFNSTGDNIATYALGYSFVLAFVTVLVGLVVGILMILDVTNSK